jgi:hypothetical protein
VAGKTRVDIRGEDFWMNNTPTYYRRSWRELRIEGLLFNSRMVQATFDDLNPETRQRWVYPDTGQWDADRNTREFVEMLPVYRAHGVLAVTVNLQGGSPESYSHDQPWINSAFTPDGDLREAYMTRLRLILERLDDLGMVALVGLFYFGQDERLTDEAAVKRSVEHAVRWILDHGFTNVLIEINNECDVPRYEHAILRPERVHELIQLAQSISRPGQRLNVGTSFRGGAIPTSNVVACSDLLLLHGNGVHDPASIEQMVTRTRSLTAYRGQPIVFNEDDHYEFDQPRNNLLAATTHHASWGYFDAGPGAGGSSARSDYVEGFQNVPVNWRLSTERKLAFFDRVREQSGV